jgi:hypothetical protein
MAGLVPAISLILKHRALLSEVAGTSPATTKEK